MVWVGAMSTLDFVWGLADITMELMAICNLIAIAFLGKYAFRLLQDYREQKKKRATATNIPPMLPISLFNAC